MRSVGGSSGTRRRLGGNLFLCPVDQLCCVKVEGWEPVAGGASILGDVLQPPPPLTSPQLLPLSHLVHSPRRAVSPRVDDRQEYSLYGG